MRCKKCGQALSRGQTVCPSCGTDVGKQIRRTRNRRRFIFIVLLIILLSAGLIGLNLYTRGQLNDFSLTGIRSLFRPDAADPTAEPEPTEEPQTAEEPEPTAEAEPTVEPEAVPVMQASEPAPAEDNAVEATPAPAEERDPLAQYRAVESENAAACRSAFTAWYESRRAAISALDDRQTLSRANLIVSSTAREALTALTSYDLSWLSTLTLTTDSRLSGDLSGAEAVLTANDVAIATLRAFLDLNSGSQSLVLPEISEQAFTPGDVGGTVLTARQLAAAAQALPTGEELDALLQRYGALALNNIDAVTRGSGVLEAEGILQPCTTFAVTLDRSSTARLLSALIGELRWDDTVKTAVCDVAEALGASPDGAYDSFLSKLDAWDYQLSGLSGTEAYLQMQLFVDESGVIHGRSLQTADGLRLSLAVPRDGERFGFELRYAAQEHVYELAGRGRCLPTACSGEFALRADSESLARFSLDTARSGEQVLVFDLTAVPRQSLYAANAPEALQEYLHDLSLTLHSEGNGVDYASAKLELQQAGRAVLSLFLTQGTGTETELTAPEEAISLDSWYAALSAESFDTILENLKTAGLPAGLGLSLRMSLEDAFGAAPATAQP